MLIDLHAHSHLSKDCELTPKSVLDRAELLGLDGVAFTETNTQDGCEELFEVGEKSNVKVFVGLELVTDRGQFLCFFPKPEEAPEPVQLWGSNRDRPWPASECLPKLASLGAAIVAARPYDRESPNPPLDGVSSLTGLCAVEGYNAKVRQAANELALEAAEKMGLPTVGGSDARGSLDEVGRGATFFKEHIDSSEGLVKALSGKAYWAVAVGDLPELFRPGEAREAEKSAGKKRRKPFRGRAS